MNTEEDKLAVDISEEITHKRGRLEYRKTFVYNNIEEISPEWVGLKTTHPRGAPSGIPREKKTRNSLLY